MLRRCAPCGSAVRHSCGLPHFFALFVLPVPHTGPRPHILNRSARLRCIMRFVLLLLSCRGEGL
ncbi:hypothetical protein GPN2_11674 [Streptomyces murinus]